MVKGCGSVLKTADIVVFRPCALESYCKQLCHQPVILSLLALNQLYFESQDTATLGDDQVI